uniref:Uncharacterized protein n=1 Tax=Anguilla anguilla TaxID=7936 RepID=A0A0E9V687_ANGAN
MNNIARDRRNSQNTSSSGLYSVLFHCSTFSHCTAAPTLLFP